MARNNRSYKFPDCHYCKYRGDDRVCGECDDGSLFEEDEDSTGDVEPLDFNRGLMAAA